MSSGASGFAITNKLPGAVTQVLFGASPSSGAGGLRYILLLGNKVAAGTATLDTTSYDILTPDDALTYAGKRSELYLAAVALFKKYPQAKVKLIAVTQAVGAAASATLTMAGGSAVGSGNLYIYIHGVQVVVGVTSGQTVAQIATNVSNAINAAQLDASLLVSASPAAGVVTITASHLGTRGNAIKLRTVVDTSITVTTFTLSAAQLSGGTGTDSLTTALTTAAAARYFYYVPAQVDQTNLQAVQTQLLTLAGATSHKKGCMITAVCDTLATATTTSQTWLNEVRAQILWHNKGEDIPFVVAAGWAGSRALAETNNPNAVLMNLWDNQGFTDLFGVCNPQPNDGDLMSDTMASSGLDVGLTPIQARPGDKHCVIVRSITSHSLDSSSNPDTRTLDTNMQAVPDAWADDVEAYIPTQFANKVLFDDTDIGDDDPPENATTPKALKVALAARARKNWVQKGQFKSFDTDYLSWDFTIAPSPAIGRVNATMPIHPAPWFSQFSAQIRQNAPS